MDVPNRLGMKDWIVLETQEDAYNMRVVAGKPVQPEVCPRCGAENPREAAELALSIMLDSESTATTFDVTDEAGETTRVDLEDTECPS